jgi:tRNA(Ile)-lysidine synthase
MTFSLEELSQALPADTRQTVSAERAWWVAYSGGLDSTVLLHALAMLNLPVSLRAIHVNHQISLNAHSWQEHCVVICQQLKIPLVIEKVIVKNTGKGIEDAARELRHDAFKKHLATGDILFTAHHADDQAETLLLRLFRGAGPAGLSAMARERECGDGILYRPLLSFTRAELEAYAEDNELMWINDESNSDDHYNRNFLRNQVIPLLQQRWPTLTQQLQRTAELCAQQEVITKTVAQEDFALLGERQERVGKSIDLTVFSHLPTARQQNLLRYWLAKNNYDLPEYVHWEEFQQQIFHARDDAHTELRWGNVSLRLFQQRLYLLPIELPEFKLTFQLSTEKLALRLNLSPEQLEIRYRKGGERCKPAGRAHSQTLKKLLQEYVLEPWLRDQVPLVYYQDQIVAVGDLWICEGFVAQANESGYALSWVSFPHPSPLPEGEGIKKSSPSGRGFR